MIAVSNRELYREMHGAGETETYIHHLAKLEQAEYKPDMLILREKNLPEEAYERLLERVWNQCREKEMQLIPHTYLQAAQKLGIPRIHLPLALLKQYVQKGRLQDMESIGASVHSVEEAVMAETLGATYVTAGHIFATNCKPGLAPRGIEFLEEVCGSVKIPVYAIGGIHPKNLGKIKETPAAGACLMSEYMK